MSKLRTLLAEEGLLTAGVRRYVRPAKSYRPGQFVWVDGGAGGDYKGMVLKNIPRMTKPAEGVTGEVRTEPGMEIRVDWWDGQWLEGQFRFEIQAWNSEARPWVRTPGDREKRASTGLECNFYKASDGKWYMALEEERYDDDDDGYDPDPEMTHYGPFASEDLAIRFLDRNFANPGGWSTDTSGRRRPPRNPVRPR